ncbi:MAG: HEAT repeat domain-containing protein [Planctomycetota bacterium]|nr:HEAT repeat domain-containing protein [Planctomycetota bacterium]
MNRSWKTISLIISLSLFILGGASRAADDAAERTAAAIRTAQNWKDGDPAGDLSYLGDVVVAAGQDATQKQTLEQLLLQGLAGAKTRAAKDFFCRQLVVVGTAAAVPELAKLLPDPESSHIARYALARLPGPAADAALLEALGTVDEKLKIGMVQSLGTRGCREAVNKIATLLGSSHQELVVAALVALGRIDSDAAVAAVAKARGSVPAKLQAAATDAYLDCAARLLKQGQTAEAQAIYQKLFAFQEPSLSRTAALTGLVAAQKEQAMATVIAALGDKDAKVRKVAAAMLRYVPGAEATKAIVGTLTGQADEVQVMLLAVLADRGDVVALPAVVKAADAATPTVRLAALAALAALGDVSVVPMLVKRAAEASDSAEPQTARSSLANLKGNAVNAEIARQLGSELQTVRIEAAKSLAVRGAADQVAALFRAAEDQDAAVATEALKALRILATADYLPALVNLLVATKVASVRGEAENTVVAAAGTTPANKNPAEPVLAALPGATEAEACASLIRVLGRIGQASALPVLNESLKDSRVEVKDAAVRALADWPTGDPAKVLLRIATEASASNVHRVLALRGFVNQIAKQANASDEQILDDYAHAIQIASRPEEKQLVLSKLALVRHRRALELVRGLLGEPALKPTAEAAIQSIDKLLAMPARVTASKSPEKAGNAIDKDPNTRWDTGGPQTGGEWFRIELDEDRLITGIVLDAQGSGGDYPRGYEVYVSASSLGDGQRVAQGKGTDAVTKIMFDKPVRGKAIKIVQTGEVAGLFWSIHELTIESQPVDKK